MRRNNPDPFSRCRVVLSFLSSLDNGFRERVSIMNNYYRYLKALLIRRLVTFLETYLAARKIAQPITVYDDHIYKNMVVVSTLVANFYEIAYNTLHAVLLVNKTKNTNGMIIELISRRVKFVPNLNL